MTTIKWTIAQLDCYPEAAGMTNVASTAHWRCEGQDGEYSASAYGTCSFPVPEDEIQGFTLFDKLTESQVLSWVWASGVDKTAAETAINSQIENLKNPPIITPALPWAA